MEKVEFFKGKDEGVVSCGIEMQVVGPRSGTGHVAIVASFQVLTVDPRMPLVVASAKSIFFTSQDGKPADIEVPLSSAFIEEPGGKRLELPGAPVEAAGGLQYVEKYTEGGENFLRALAKAPVTLGVADMANDSLSYKIAASLSKSDQKRLDTCLASFRKFIGR